MKDALRFYEAELAAIREAGTYKDERIITTPQRSRIDTTKADGVVEPVRQQLSGPGRQRGADRRRQGKLRPLGLRPVPACASSAARRVMHQRTGNAAGRVSSAWRTPSSIPAASTPTAACLKRFWGRRTRSFPTNSTTPRSSTACACARPSACATRTTTWPTCAPSWKRPPARASSSSPPTACFPWTASSPTCPPSAIWPRNTARW